MVVIKLFLELLPGMREHEAGTVTKLQHQLRPLQDGRNLPVVIFDISSISRVQAPSREFGIEITPTAPLKALLDALGTFDPKPKAIAFDIDFSNRSSRALLEGDRELFEKARKLREGGLPVFFGVGEQAFAESGNRFPNGTGEEFAAGILGSVFAWRIPAATCSPGSHKPFLSLSEQLARVIRPRAAESFPSETSPWWQRYVSQFATAECGDRGHLIERTVDLSQLASLRDSRIRIVQGMETNAVKLASDRLGGRVVLIGDGVPIGDDQVRVPGFSDHDLAGIYFHASAALTPEAGELYELTSTGRLVADIVIASGVFLVIALICIRKTDKTGRPIRPIAVHWLVSGIAAVGIYLIGNRLIPFTRILWIDYDLVIVAILSHWFLEIFMEGFSRDVGEITHNEPDPTAK
jgi:CHASE2 domain-containing sensor protein